MLHIVDNTQRGRFVILQVLLSSKCLEDLLTGLDPEEDLVFSTAEHSWQ